MNNFFVYLFFSIGIITTIKLIIQNILELRFYWKEGEWQTKKECFLDFCYKKVKRIPLNIYQDSQYDCDTLYNEYYHNDEYDEDKYDYNKCDYYDNIDEIEDTKEDNEIEVTLYGFKSVEDAQMCCKSINQSDRYIYNVNGKVYALLECTMDEEEILELGAIALEDEEISDVFNEIVDYDTRFFEFIDEEAASFFIYKYNVNTIINYFGHIFIDLSDRDDDEMPMIRRMAIECFGLEVSDKFLVEKLRNLKS